METFNRACSNPWCKAPFTYTSEEIITVEDEEIHPKECRKCLSFSNELSGGVTWTDKNYEGSIYDDGPHQVRYRITNFR
jgi:hypothetical protein